MYQNYKEVINEPIFQEYLSKKNITKVSIKRDAGDLMRYCNSQKTTLQELYTEADTEEEQQIREKHRTLTKRLEGLRQLLYKQGYSTTVVNQTFTTTKNFYRLMRIALPYIPPMALPETQKGYEDIPNKEHIKQALDTTNNRLHKALILFMFSSCSAVAETLSITCQMFVDATKEYHNKQNIIDVINELEDKKDIVPFFLLKRQKMKRKYAEGYKYYTCCTPEATKQIIKYLKHRVKREKIYKNHILSNEDKLFKIQPTGINMAFSRINDHQDNDWGKIDHTRFFHPHSMRIAGNTAIENIEDGNLFSGRKRNSIQESYFKKNPERIKELYVKYIPQLSIQDTAVHDIKSKEYKKLENENKELSERISSLETKETKKSKADIIATNLSDDQLDKMLSFLKKE